MLLNVTGRSEVLEQMEEVKKHLEEAGKILYRLPMEIGIEFWDESKYLSPEKSIAVDMFKVGKVLPKIMQLMQEEGVTMAEAEVIPEFLKKQIKKNTELSEKGKQFSVHEKLLKGF